MGSWDSNRDLEKLSFLFLSTECNGLYYYDRSQTKLCYT